MYLLFECGLIVSHAETIVNLSDYKAILSHIFVFLLIMYNRPHIEDISQALSQESPSDWLP